MGDMNSWTATGRMVADPELRTTGNGKQVCSFRIAVERTISREAKDRGDMNADFFQCVAWGNRAEYASQYLTKGRCVWVQGRLEMREFTDKQTGQQRREPECIIAEIGANGPPVGRNDNQRNDVNADELDDPFAY